MSQARTISIIVAMDRNRLIGQGGDLPWRLPNDLAHFKRVTLGKTVLMGRKTWQSLPRALPGRQNWVVSRQANLPVDGGQLFACLDEALAAHQEGELMVIGGADLYRQVLPQANTLYVTRVDCKLPAQGDGDVHFPEFDESHFVETWREPHAADARHAFGYTFLKMERL